MKNIIILLTQAVVFYALLLVGLDLLKEGGISFIGNTTALSGLIALIASGFIAGRAIYKK